MAMSTVQKGKIVEATVANLLCLVSDGLLNPSIPISDDSGIDMILNKKASYQVVFVQIKSRFVTRSKQRNLIDFSIRKATFRPSDRLYVLCVYFDEQKAMIDTMWLIPSNVIPSAAVSLELGWRIVAGRNPSSNDKWSKYRVTPEEICSKLSDLL